MDKVLTAISRYNMLASGGRVAAAVSGGRDSVCLLHVLLELAPRLGFTVAAVAHFNHQLRGEASEADERFVAELAARYGVAFVCEREAVAEAGGNLEQSARRARQAFFSRLIRDGVADRIATGHTSDDQAETVLFRLLRGSGLAGLAGIFPVTAEGLIRPMLDVTRAEVEQFLEERGIPWREDASNQDERFARNRIRHNLLPQLAREWNPRVSVSLAHLADLAREEEQWWRKEISRLAEDLLVPAQGGIEINAGRLTALPRAVARRLVRLARPLLHGRGSEEAGGLLAQGRGSEAAGGLLAHGRGSEGATPPLPYSRGSEAAGRLLAQGRGSEAAARLLAQGRGTEGATPPLPYSRGSEAAGRLLAHGRGSEGATEPRASASGQPRPTQLAFDQVEAILELAAQPEGDGKLELPGLTVIRSFGWLRFMPPAREPDPQPVHLRVPGKYAWLGGPTHVCFEIAQGDSRQTGCVSLKLRGGRIPAPLELRGWSAGDHYRPAGHSRDQKIKELFQEARVPSWRRRFWPIVTSGPKILWARWFGAAAEYAAEDEPGLVLRIWEENT